MSSTSSQRFDSIASNYATSEVHISSPTLARLHTLLPRVETVCDVASGAGHTGLSFAENASRIVAIDPAPKMLGEFRKLAVGRRGVVIDTVEAFAESIPLPSESFDLVVCRLAAHHFTDVDKTMREMTRLAKSGGYVAVIDLEGDENLELDALNHDIEMLHDPTHVRSYTSRRWREMFAANSLEVISCEGRCWEIAGGLTVRRWCELGNSGQEALRAIQNRLAAAPADWLAQLEITRDADGGFRIPVRTLLIFGRKGLRE
jgi:ubiquinone/menaquinone biosynthesis C-methylase UbiE